MPITPSIHRIFLMWLLGSEQLQMETFGKLVALFRYRKDE